jgi:hypothetical protein
VLPWESRRTRRSGRDRRHPDQTVLECLEGRELLAYTPLGFSLPDLTVSGYAAPAASWNGTLAVTVTVQNLGASTLDEPLALAPGSTSTADAPATTVEVFASKRTTPGAKETPIGSINIPSVPQNSDVTITQNLTMPARPPGFPGNGGTVYVSFVVNPPHNVSESDYTNNASGPKPVLIAAPFPKLEAIGLDVPQVMQPGDTIAPNIQVANLGPADTLPQGPVAVALVASTTPTFNRGSSIVATYSVPNIPGIQNVPERSPSITARATLSPLDNVVTIMGQPVTLAIRPKKYFLGVVVDPSNTIKQLPQIGNVKGVGRSFSLSHKVGPPIRNLPPAGVVVPGGGANNPLFPNPVGITAPPTTNPQFPIPGGVLPPTT